MTMTNNIPPEPPVGTWMKDRFGGTTMHHEGGGWAPPGCVPFGRWEAMWEARGPYMECGPWGDELDKTARQDMAGPERDGGEGHGALLGLVGSSGQASGDLLARHLPCPMFTSMLMDALWQVWSRQITAPEQRAVDDCLQAVRDLIAKLGGRTEDR